MNKKHDNHKWAPDIPEDEGLPGLPVVFDTDIIKESLENHLAKSGLSIIGCEISYIRYKPRTSCIIVYNLKASGPIIFGLDEIPVCVKIFTESGYRIADEKARLRRWVHIEGIAPYILFPEKMAILYFFPNDPVIDGLRILEHPKKIQRILYQHYKKYPENKWRISNKQLKIWIKRYKPERRAVLKLRTKAYSHFESDKKKIKVYTRIYADDRGERVFNLQDRLYKLSKSKDHLRIPKPIYYLADYKILLMKELKGKSLLDCIRDGRLASLEHTAAALAFLHGQDFPDLERIAPDSLLERSLESHQMISEIIPDLSEETDRIYKRLSDEIEGISNSGVGFVHGDFHHGQVIINNNQAGIIDFDRSYTGDPGADLGNFIANLKLLHLKGALTYSQEAVDIFISEYESASGKKLEKDFINFWTAFSLFQLAVNPFREYQDSWREKTDLILKECRSLLK
jgi:thiamine kinase-like enzyme